MSADRPYQSHLFNLLNRSVQRAKDKAGLLWRNFKVNAKVAVLWGAQISLYPIYAVLNASRRVARQVGQQLRAIGRSTQDSSSAPIPDSDAPFLSVLTALVTRQIAILPAGDADCLTIVLAQGTQIQGFASVLSTRRLTIVTTTNETLDILSERQENELRQRIIYEIAIYWRLVRSRRINPVSTLKVSAVQIPTLWDDRRSLVPSDPSLGFQRDWSSLIQAAWHYFFGGLFDRTGPSQLWGRSGDGVLVPSAQTNAQTSVQVNAIETDLWADSLGPSMVSMNKPIVQRYDRSKRLNFVAKTALTLSAAATTTALPPTLDSSPFNTLKHWIQSRLGSASLSIIPSAPQPVIPVLTARPNAFLSAPSRPSRAATKRIARAPEWLEVPATHLGYDVSWLDRLVLGLDKAIVFLEQLFLTFWAWLQVLRKS